MILFSKTDNLVVACITSLLLMCLLLLLLLLALLLLPLLLLSVCTAVFLHVLCMHECTT
jgi:hypothetical protein